MKKLAILVVLALVVTVPAYAQLGDTDNSSFTIQNLGTGSATVTVTFYNEAGASFTPNPILTGVTNPFTLGAGGNQSIYMPSVLGLADGRYSVVIESTEPIGVIANLIGKTAGGAPFYNGSYSGFDMGATTIYFPSTQYEFYNWNSLMSIQNTTASSISVDFTIYDENGAQKATRNYPSVPAFSSVHLDLETQGAAPLGLPAGLNGSAKVVCSGACVGTDNQTADGGFTQSYNAFLSGDTTLFAPSLYNGYYTWNGSLKVQNIGGSPTNIDVTYFVEGGGTCTAPTENTPANKALYHYLPTQWAGWGCPSSADKIIGAKIVSSSQNVVGVVNAANPGKQAQTYGTLATSEGASQVGLPVIMNNYSGWNTAFVCQNLGGANATVNYTYSGVGCPGGGCSFSLTPGEAKSRYQPADAGLAGNTGLFAVTVTATGAPVACIANETQAAGQQAQTGDWSMSYNGFGQ